LTSNGMPVRPGPVPDPVAPLGPESVMINFAV
jgi:hypothetical protein